MKILIDGLPYEAENGRLKVHLISGRPGTVLLVDRSATSEEQKTKYQQKLVAPIDAEGNTLVTENGSYQVWAFGEPKPRLSRSEKKQLTQDGPPRAKSRYTLFVETFFKNTPGRKLEEAGVAWKALPEEIRQHGDPSAYYLKTLKEAAEAVLKKEQQRDGKSKKDSKKEKHQSAKS